MRCFSASSAIGKLRSPTGILAACALYIKELVGLRERDLADSNPASGSNQFQPED